MKLFYDLHLHSCLSPCASDDMTPANLAAMCHLAGLDVVALTDHNTADNCAAFCRAAERHGLLALAGMELCTREDIHIVCLFPTPEAAEAFSREVSCHLPSMRNNPAFFGRQLRMDEYDSVLGEEFRLLSAHTKIGVEEVCPLVECYGGVAFPAHIDRPSFSLLGVLGLWDPSFAFPLAELSPACPPELIQRPDLTGLRLICNSDAHYLDQIYDARSAMDLPSPTPQAVLNWLRFGPDQTGYY